MKRRLPLLLLAAPLLAGCPSPRPGGATASPAPTAGTSTAALTGTLFAEVADGSGLKFQWALSKGPLNILQTIGNGAALLDYDNDGNLDALLVGPKPALFKGDGHGKFTDVSASTGIGKLSGHFLGVAVGDYDNDGFPDLYISGYREGRLLHNDGGKGFTDATAASGLKPQPWGTSATFSDLDGDGKLDLYVGNYAVFGPNTQPQLCLAHGILTSCGPREYKPERGILCLGDGKGGFKDVTKAWGASTVSGRTLGVAAADFDGSGKQSLTLANDETPGDLLHNGGGKVENIAPVAGTAYDASGGVHGGMGTDWGDYDNDGKLDLFVTTYQNEIKNLYHNDGGQLFSDRATPLNLTPASPLVGFGTKWLDIDNDGWLDLVVANGHVQDNIEQVDKSTVFHQPTLLFRNASGQRFDNVSAQLDDAGRRAIVGRGLAIGDIDNDGRVDILVVDSSGKPLLLHNTVAGAGHWLGLKLSQPTGGNRDGYGATVTVTVGGRILTRHCHADGSYLSSSDPRVHVGLGVAAKPDKVTVRWPDGKEEAFADVPADRYVTLERGGVVK